MKRNGAKHKKNGRAKRGGAGYGKKGKMKRIGWKLCAAMSRDGEEWRPGQREEEEGQ